MATDAEDKAKFKERLENLVSKLTAIENNSEFQGIWGLLHSHGYRYNGPNWAKELDEARAELARHP